MKVWAFDPGSSFTGLAGLIYDGWPHVPEDTTWAQYSDPVDLYNHYHHDFTHMRNEKVLVEDFSHGGAFTLEAKQTIEIVGFLTRQLYRDGYKVERRHKDKRLSGQSEAAKLMGGTVAELKKDPAKKDAFSALAHCITYAREA
jgi:hypothetical protein